MSSPESPDCGFSLSPDPKRPSVLMLVTSLTFGGAEMQVVHLAIELKRRGWRTKVICLVDPDAYVEQLTAEEIEVCSLSMPRGIPDPRAIWRLRKHILLFKPDVLHCHMVHANLLGRVTRLFCRIPVLISTVHNLQERSERGGDTRYKEILYRATDFLSDTTTIVCSAAFERYVRIRAVPPKKLEVVANGIHTTRFTPNPCARLSDRLSLGLGQEFAWLAVGRLVEQKNYSLLLRALSVLPERGWVLLVAGGGPLESELKDKCARLGLNRMVRFLGAQEEVFRLYNAADAFVMASDYEGLSVALLEAASMSLPGVVTNVGGNADVVLDGVTGFVVKPGDHVELAKAMQTLLEMPSAGRSSVGAAARKHCVTHFQFEAIADQWIGLYRRCMQARSARRLSTAVNAHSAEDVAQERAQ